MVGRKATDARKLVKALLRDHGEKCGIARDIIVNKLQIYSGNERKIGGLAKEAVGKVVSTEHLIFR
jgi:hypothetical protein